ncbi:MAG: TadG family pilus assembly protein [Gemmatales bacterium]
MIHHPTRLNRRGAMWPLMLGCLVLLMAGVALAVDGAFLWQARQELQVAADASALGAALELTDDQLLLKQPGVMYGSVLRSFSIAQHLASRHHVLGIPLQLDTNEDVAVGYFNSETKSMQPASPGDWDSPYLNAIEVMARRTRERGTPVGLFFTRIFQLQSADVSATATAVLDRQIVGFRATAALNIPMMPIGVFSDPTGMDELTWEYQIDKPLSLGNGGLDEFAFNKFTRRWLHVSNGGEGDGLPEFVLKIPISTVIDETNGCLLQIGRQDGRTLPRQMENGLTVADLEAYHGQLQLGWDGLLPLDEAPVPRANTLANMVEVLETLSKTGEARLWPLYLPGPAIRATPTVTGDSTSPLPSTGVALIRGFVAARVCTVELTDKYLELVIQPTVLTTGTALTEPSGPVNQYVGKIRLVR